MQLDSWVKSIEISRILARNAMVFCPFVVFYIMGRKSIRISYE